MTGVALARRLAAELIGTFCLVVCGCGAIMVSSAYGTLGALGVSLAFGVVIMVMVAALGHVSGDASVVGVPGRVAPRGHSTAVESP